MAALLEAYTCDPCDDGYSYLVPVVVIVSWRVYGKVIRRVVESAPELHFTPEHAEIVRLGGQSQASLSKIDPRIKPGQRTDLYTKFAEVKVASIEKKML